AAHLHRVVHDVEAGHAGDAAGGRQVGGEDAHDGRLAGAVVAEQADDLVLLDLEADVVDRHDGAEELAQVLDVDHAWSHPARKLVGPPPPPPPPGRGGGVAAGAAAGTVADRVPYARAGGPLRGTGDAVPAGSPAGGPVPAARIENFFVGREHGVCKGKPAAVGVRP